MKLLLDEMYAGLKEYFETLGHEVLTAQEAGLKAAKDKDIVEYAGKHGLILVTQDQKPAELAELTGVKYVLISNALIAKIAHEKIKERYELFASCSRGKRKLFNFILVYCQLLWSEFSVHPCGKLLGFVCSDKG